MSMASRILSVACTAALSLFASPAPTLAFGPIATKAKCGAKDRPETGLQGQVTMAERFAAQGRGNSFNCNLELVGQHAGDGANVGFAITDRCAYVEQWMNPLPLPQLKTPGLMVFDVADSAKPKLVKYLRTPATLHPNESPIVNLERKLLIAHNIDKSRDTGATTDIYDISDCTNPVLKFSGIIPGFIFHVGDFSPDGTILWTSTGPVLRKDEPDVGDTLSALDISDPTHPKLLAQWKTDDPRYIRFHGLSLSDDGNTAYYTIGEHSYSVVNGSVTPAPYQGIGLLDISEVNARKPDARIKMIGEPVFWDDIVHNQYIYPFAQKGKRYLWENRIDGVIGGETKVHSGFKVSHPGEGPEQACKKGKPAWGYVSIFDIDDPTRPQRVSALKLEVQDPKNCLATAYDPVISHGYSPLNCDIDNYQDAKMMVCGFTEGGVRVFDIRDIKRPREIAYYKPPAVGAAVRAASPYQHEGAASPAAKYHTADAIAYPRFARGAKEIWFSSFDNGFQVLRFSQELLEREKALFSDLETCYGGLRPMHGCPKK